MLHVKNFIRFRQLFEHMKGEKYELIGHYKSKGKTFQFDNNESDYYLEFSYYFTCSVGSLYFSQALPKTDTLVQEVIKFFEDNATMTKDISLSTIDGIPTLS